MIAFIAATPATAQLFSDLRILNANAKNDSGTDQSPQVAGDRAGNWVAVWQSTDSLVGTIGTDWDILFSRSTDRGTTWTTPSALNSTASTDSAVDYDENPHISTDGLGNWVVVWQSNYDMEGDCCSDYEIFFARSTDEGATWTAPAPLNSDFDWSSGDNERPRITNDGAGIWMTVWQARSTIGGTVMRGWNIAFARSTDGGATWSTAALLNRTANRWIYTPPNYTPDVATDGAGNWLTVWSSRDSLRGTIGDDRDIQFARSTNGGETWSVPRAVASNATNDVDGDWNPSITSDGSGAWVVAWTTWDSLGDTIGGEGDILVAHSTNLGATWSPTIPLNTNAQADSGSDIFPKITTDRAGNWVTTWESTDSLGGAIGDDRDVLVARSTDLGASWTPPESLNSNATSDEGTDAFPTIATDTVGNWLAAWVSSNPLGNLAGTDYDIFCATGWGPDVDDDGLSDGAELNVYGTNSKDPDTDADGLSDGAEVEVYGTDPLDSDSDADGILDSPDNCPLIANPDQLDMDGDGEGNACDSDVDADGIANEADNCPFVPNTAQNDFDGDGRGDACDEDVDDDGIGNAVDQCGFTPIDEIVEPDTGCSLDEIVPCDGPRDSTRAWRNHGEFVSAFAIAAHAFAKQGLISAQEKRMHVGKAARSDCGSGSPSSDGAESDSASGQLRSIAIPALGLWGRGFVALLLALTAKARQCNRMRKR